MSAYFTDRYVQLDKPDYDLLVAKAQCGDGHLLAQIEALKAANVDAVGKAAEQGLRAEMAEGRARDAALKADVYRKKVDALDFSLKESEPYRLHWKERYEAEKRRADELARSKVSEVTFREMLDRCDEQRKVIERQKAELRKSQDALQEARAERQGLQASLNGQQAVIAELKGANRSLAGDCDGLAAQLAAIISNTPLLAIHLGGEAACQPLRACLGETEASDAIKGLRLELGATRKELARTQGKLDRATRRIAEMANDPVGIIKKKYPGARVLIGLPVQVLASE